MSRLTTFSIPEVESFLLAFEKSQTMAVAHLAQSAPEINQSSGRGNGGRTNRGGKNGRGGRFQGNRPECQLCGRFGHVVQTCDHRFDPHYQSPTHATQQQVPYSSTMPPPPSTSFH
ncbi:hypothetical protein PIB30_074084 [Stylosanthes scabra]|uniref:CCHC-type domain-containing protein n=1 Tax=Stylosanthes scabra TaxID=79078 RepID=A0ABU6WMU4_9FABA|nr:hypothetical protein [Stylosanthes scabra]